MVSNKKYSIAEAARELGMTRAGVHAAIRQKRLKAKRGTLICLIWILLARAAYGQTVIPYDIQIVNVLNIEDLNVREEHVATTFASNLLSGTLYLRKNKYKPVTVNCGGDTQPSKLNNKSQLVG